MHTSTNWVIANWPAIVALVGGGSGLSIFLQYVLVKLHIDSKKLAFTLIHLLSIGVAASAFYLDNVNAIGAYTGLVIIAQTVHRFAVSPYYNRYILPYLTFLSENAAQVTTQYVPPQEQPVASLEAAPAFVS